MQAAKVSDPQPLPFELALRIRHPSIDPALISKELQLEARHCFKAGQLRQPHSNLTPPSYHAESYWLGTLDLVALYPTLPLFDMPAAERPTDRSTMETAKERMNAALTRDLDMALTWCTRHLLRAHADFLRRIRTDGGQAHLLVTLSSSSASGFTLTPELSRTLADLGVTLNFEFTLRE